MIELRYTLVKNGMFFCVWYVFHSHGSLPDNYHHNATSVFKYVFSYLVTEVCFFLMDLTQHVTKWTTVSSSKQSLANHNLSLGETKIPLKAC